MPHALSDNLRGEKAMKHRERLLVRGRVQGVGFRPSVYRLAHTVGLAGLVGNDAGGAFIEIEGTQDQLAAFKQQLLTKIPRLVAVREVKAESIPVRHETDFRIEASRDGAARAEITPDIATCPECLAELLDPADRRHGYAFINCTQCGPRYSIIESVPYDRANTTMHGFRMCPQCQAEYDDPANRRFHAEPNACPVCGPRLWLEDREGKRIHGEALRTAAQWLAHGAILAIKGIGGFHLCCCAEDAVAVQRLRERKIRDAKPFAIMVACVEAARQLVELTEAAERALLQPSRPIVVLPRLKKTAIAHAVAPTLDTLGIMLPYTPLHHLLFREGLGPLVMTSGNATSEPLCIDNDEALERLSGLADAFLLHDRPIVRRLDDPVAIGGTSGVVPVRRGRGEAPEPIHLRTASPVRVLALGAELKSSICLLRGREAILSEHLGDLASPAAYRHFVWSLGEMGKQFGFDTSPPEVVAMDLHPDYAATRFGNQLAGRHVFVQHHHAHLAACLADNDAEGPAIGVICDGTGLGADGAIWGGEILVGDAARFERFAHLRYFPLAGGDRAAQQTWRPLAGLMARAHSADWETRCKDLFAQVPEDELKALAWQLRDNRQCIETSSMGRLFDAVAFLLGVETENTFEGQAAAALEALAAQCSEAPALPFRILAAEGKALELDWQPAIDALLVRRAEGLPVARLARAFHDMLADMLSEVASRAARQTGIQIVALSGGCFANRLLLEGLRKRLTAAGLVVLQHRRVPTTDGGVSLGQAMVASALSRRDA